jgi:acyl-coenzyme A synthetase/AMP-(fatty) acid ligase
VKSYQAVVTRPENRDVVTLRVALQDGVEAGTALEEALRAAVEAAARLRVDAVEFVAPDGIEAGARVMVDARTWE